MKHFGSRKTGNCIGVRCRDCGKVQIVPKIVLARAARLKCDRCGCLALPCEAERARDLKEGRFLRSEKKENERFIKHEREQDIDTRLDQELDARFGRRELFTTEEKRAMGILTTPMLPSPKKKCK